MPLAKAAAEANIALFSVTTLHSLRCIVVQAGGRRMARASWCWAALGSLSRPTFGHARNLLQFHSPPLYVLLSPPPFFLVIPPFSPSLSLFPPPPPPPPPSAAFIHRLFISSLLCAAATLDIRASALDAFQGIDPPRWEQREVLHVLLPSRSLGRLKTTIASRRCDAFAQRLVLSFVFE